MFKWNDRCHAVPFGPFEINVLFRMRGNKRKVSDFRKKSIVNQLDEAK